MNFNKYFNIKWTNYYWENIKKIDNLEYISSHYFCNSPYITFEIMNKNTEYFFSNKNVHYDVSSEIKKKLCLNPNITLDIIENNPILFDDFYFISKNPNLNWEFICKYINQQWDWSYLTTVMPLKIITENPSYPWSYINLCLNSELTWDYIKKNINENWNWFLLSSHICITLDIVKQTPNLNWNESELTKNPNITIEHIKNNLREFKWDWATIVFNPNITQKQIEENEFLPWRWYIIFKFMKLDNRFLDKYAHKIYPEYSLRNCLITNKYLDINYLINKYPNIQFNNMFLMYVSSNENITFDFINKHKLNFRTSLWNSFTENRLTLEFNNKKKECLLKWTSARILQRAWRLCRYNPNYKMCHKVQLRDMEEIYKEYNEKLD